ncbi:DNA-binding CsgD family transcriptional regulator [Mycolicibacterium sp. BK556]|uniref:helix-turn-helix transcriptional regulator n=1 Tax=unclassified Mycolicibacterium TaxID=2636767 RepID=UPI00161E6A13|nr:DNA-binding CsgD family transcriptional regulator [Mycolicibacterium sp. BK556]MBB3632552.1 DNA-binding CsgD family transcriptional regulator [Mycolicibacterium sp. BK607]
MTDNAELADRLPLELCQAGFSRVLFSRIERNMWLVRSAHIAGDTDLTDTLLRVGRAHPRRLCAPLPESAMVRTRVPILVTDPQSNPRVNADLVGVVKPDVYVAAPVYVWQNPIGLLHADAPSASGDVGTEDRDLLGLFAQGLGAIMERNIVVERIRSLHIAAQGHAGEIRSLAELLDSSIDMAGCESAAGMTLENHQEGNAERLTRRELQVLRLMSVGNTNGQIAARLFISEGTVKSHVRHIMQKLEASNRTDAVARYHLSQQRPPSAAETLTP